MTLDMEHLNQWIGRTEVACEQVTQALVDRYLATISIAKPIAGEAPLGIQWCLTPAAFPLDQLGSDGHPAKGGFLPPVPYARRMWAGGALEFHAPIRVGEAVTRRSTITDIQAKSGKSGALCFVTVKHDYLVNDEVRVAERQDIVYRDGTLTPTPKHITPLPKPDHTITIDPSPTLLFRFSALTFNGHRIHYDHPYATNVEGYGGLVVHGPMQAILMATLAQNTLGKPLTKFSYRGVAPLDNTTAFITGLRRTKDGTFDCWCGRDGVGVSMTGTAI